MDNFTRVDALVIMLLARPVTAVSRWTGLDGFRLARLMVVATPVLLCLWWFARFGEMDFFGLFAAAIWSLVCRLKLRDFALEERMLRRDWAQGCMYLTVQSAWLRVVTLFAFLALDTTRFAIDFTTRFGVLRAAVMVVACFYCTIYGLALYVHLIPPGPPPKKKKPLSERLKDWMRERQGQPLPVPT